MEEDEIDITKLRYALYVRKSTEDESRQIRSIEDQEIECIQLATRLGLHIIKPVIREEKSAKKPHKRPLFRQMLNDIKKGKYDAILAWNPDRLARNMLEGGEIIDLVDQEVIKDLKFVTHHFTKDANGKMLLGMAFVLSKQYSDKLSQDVTRGVRRSFIEGKTPAPKHGYYRDENGMYRPDGKNFGLIVNALKMRNIGASILEIVAYLNNNDYKRITKAGKVIRMTMQILSKIFKDPFYYGILVNRKTGEKVDLRQAYNFQPAITEYTYNAIQQLSYRKIKPNKPHAAAFYPLKMMIRCSFCGGNMYVAPSTSKTKEKYLYARCDNKSCYRKKKSIRMIKVFNFIYDFLEGGLNFSEKEYNDYYKKVTKLSDDKREKLIIEIHSKQAALKNISRELRERSLSMSKFDKGSEIWDINENRIMELSQDKQKLEEEINELRERVTDPTVDRLSIEQFLNLSKNAAAIVKAANAVVKDQICRIIFLNFTVDEEKVLSYQVKEPFATLIKQRQLSSGRGGGT